MAITPAFQAGDAGSIPVICSIYEVIDMLTATIYLKTIIARILDLDMLLTRFSHL